jgi:hypothetical protein
MSSVAKHPEFCECAPCLVIRHEKELEGCPRIFGLDPNLLTAGLGLLAGRMDVVELVTARHVARRMSEIAQESSEAEPRSSSCDSDLEERDEPPLSAEGGDQGPKRRQLDTK